MPPDIKQDQESLARILERKEFQAHIDTGQKHDNVIINFISRMLNKLWDQLQRWFPDLPSSKGMLNVMSWVIVAVVLLVLAYVIVWLSRQYVVRGRLGRRFQFTEEDKAQSARSVLGDALRAAEAGQLRESVRAMFLSFLLYAEEMRWVRLESWKTNGEYASELRSKQAALIPLFLDGARLFDRVWYGGEKVNPDECAGLYDRLLRLMDGGAADGQPG